MERVIGLDMGFGFNKSNDGRESKVFPSVVGEGTAGGFGLGSLGLKSPAASASAGDLRVSIGGRTYFLGDLAVRHSRIAHRGLSATRAEGDDIKILFLGALSQYCREAVNDFTVVTGLPPGRMHLADDLIRRVKGDHTVVRHGPNGSNEYNIRVERIEVVPQPLGTYWAEVLDSRGQLRADSRLLGGKVGVIDVGFRTTDFASIIDGEYAPSWSRTVPIGISTGYDGIAQQLYTQYNLERETFALDKAVISGQINISGRTVDITQLRDQVLGDVATKLLVEVQSLGSWPNTTPCCSPAAAATCSSATCARWCPRACWSTTRSPPTPAATSPGARTTRSRRRQPSPPRSRRPRRSPTARPRPTSRRRTRPTTKVSGVWIRERGLRSPFFIAHAPPQCRCFCSSRFSCWN